MLLSILLLFSYSMPWYINSSDMSVQPGFGRLLAHFFGGMIALLAGRFESGIPAFIIGTSMILAFILSISIMIKNKFDNWGMRKVIFVSMVVSFMLPRIPAAFGEETFSSAFSMVLYGQYVALFCSVALVLVGERVVEFGSNSRNSL